MSQKAKDGIILDSTIYMMDEGKAGFPLRMRIIQLLAVIAGSSSTVFTFLGCFPLTVRVSYVGLAIIMSSVVIFLLFVNPDYDLYKLVAAAAIYILVLLKWFPRLQNGFYHLENSVIRKASSYYGFAAIRYKVQYAMAEEDTTLLIVMSIIVITALLAAAIVRNKLINLSYLIMILPIAASFAVGKTPLEGWLVLFVLVMLFMSRSYVAGQKSAYKEQKFLMHKIYNRTAAILCLMALVVFSIMKLFVPEGRYEDVTMVNDTKTKLQDFLFNFSLEDYTDKFDDFRLDILPDRNIGTGGLNSGKLGRIDHVTYDETEHLNISVPIRSATEGIYLKGFVGSEYTGNSWEEYSKSGRDRYKEFKDEIPGYLFQPVNLGTLLLQQVSLLKSQEAGQRNQFLDNIEYYKGKIDIRYREANKDYIYAPYLTDFEVSGEAEYKYDLYAKPVSKKEYYEFEYYYGISIEEDIEQFLQPGSRSLGDYLNSEKLYRDYVYETFAKLPKEGLEQLRGDFSKDNVGEQAESIRGAISYIKNYLHSNTQYTLSPGKLPEGEDFVEYFVYENKVGYCSHYASAGVLMLRAMGIPARYVEGYAVSSSDILLEGPIEQQKMTYYSKQGVFNGLDNQVEVSVKDYNAHAWVEIYIDGCGWFPVEFTPSAGISNVNDMVGNMEDISEGVKADSELVATPTAALPEPTDIPEDSEDSKPPITQAPEEGGKDGSQTDTKTQKADKKSLFFKLILVTVVILLLIIIVYVSRRYTSIRIMRKYSTNLSRKALVLYEKVEAIMAASHCLPKKVRCLEDYIDYAREHCPYMGKSEFDTYMEVISKARFGKNMISRHEYLEALKFYRNLYYRVYKHSSPIMKIYFKIIL